MIRRKRAAEVICLLHAMEQALASYYAGEDEEAAIERLDEKLQELRDALWHEMPREHARRMDEEDGLLVGRGEWP